MTLSGTHINSSLFMMDPVPINNNFKHKPDEIFFTKGGEDDTYQHIGGQDDTFVVNDPDGKGAFHLHRNRFRETLRELQSQAHISIRQLNAEYLTTFNEVINALHLLYKSPPLYDIILKDVQEIFKDVKEIRPGSVAAYFIGCFSNDDKFPGPMGCSPKCAASLPPPDGSPGYSHCEDMVLIYTDNVFNSLNNRQSEHAYIYVHDQFDGFTHENITQLKNGGITKVTLIYGQQDGNYKEVGNPISPDQLPKKTEFVSTGSQTTSTSTSTSSASGVGIFFLILIIVIIIIVVAVLYYRNGTISF